MPSRAEGGRGLKEKSPARWPEALQWDIAGRAFVKRSQR